DGDAALEKRHHRSKDSTLMRARFAAARPQGAHDVAFPIRKDGVAKADLAGLSDADRTLAREAARAARFDGDCGAIVELFSGSGGAYHRILLVGVGAGELEDFEKAGGALTARLLTS